MRKQFYQKVHQRCFPLRCNCNASLQVFDSHGDFTANVSHDSVIVEPKEWSPNFLSCPVNSSVG